MGVDKANGGEDTHVAAMPDSSSASVKRIVSSAHFENKKAAELSDIVNYALKKLIKMKRVSSKKQSKEVFYATAESGVDLCLKYRAVRESCLVDAFAGFDGVKGAELDEVARQLRLLSGLYDQAPRSATNL